MLGNTTDPVISRFLTKASQRCPVSPIGVPVTVGATSALNVAPRPVSGPVRAIVVKAPVLGVTLPIGVLSICPPDWCIVAAVTSPEKFPVVPVNAPENVPVVPMKGPVIVIGPGHPKMFVAPVLVRHKSPEFAAFRQHVASVLACRINPVSAGFAVADVTVVPVNVDPAVAGSFNRTSG